MTLRKRRILLIISSFVFVGIAFGALLYGQGYKIDKNFNISQNGGLYVAVPFTDAQIFVNTQKKEASGLLSKGIFMSGLKPGKYSILVAKNGFWPWAKNLEIKKGIVTEAVAVILPENPSGEFLIKGSFTNVWGSPYQKILTLEETKGKKTSLIFYRPDEKIFLAEKDPLTKQIISSVSKIENLFWDKDALIFENAGSPSVKVVFDLSNNTATAQYIPSYEFEGTLHEKYDNKKEQKIWWDPETNEIFTDWIKTGSPAPYYICPEKECQMPVKIFKGVMTIKNIELFPQRKDVIMMAVGNGIYALEIDGRETRLVYPIYKGKMPTFALLGGEKSAYVLDGDSLMKISLE